MTAVVNDEVFPMSCVGLRVPLSQRPVDFVHRPVAKLGVEPFRPVAGSGKDHHPACGRVEPADDSQIDVVRLVVFLLDVLTRLFQKAGTSRFDAHGRDSRRLDQNKQMIVFVKGFYHDW